jgi:hypothetical protein
VQCPLHLPLDDAAELPPFDSLWVSAATLDATYALVEYPAKEGQGKRQNVFSAFLWAALPGTLGP